MFTQISGDLITTLHDFDWSSLDSANFKYDNLTSAFHCQHEHQNKQHVDPCAGRMDTRGSV